MNINYLLRRALLILAFGSVAFLFSCNEDEDPVQAPDASFTFVVNNDTGVVTFTNTSTGDGNSYAWNFGDTQTSTQENPTNTYAASNTYTVTLTATNAGGSDTDIQSVTVTLPDAGPQCTAETAQSVAAADLNITFFEALPDGFVTNDNAGYERVDNPDFMNAVNPSCFVGQVTRDGAASMFGNNQFTLDAKLDFNVNGSLKIKVWTPTTDGTVTLKLEDAADANVNVEVTETVTAASTWEELTFDFANADGLYDKVVLFFDLNTANSATYFFDDIVLVEGDGSGGCTEETAQSTSAADLNITFQTDPADDITVVSDNAGYSRIANPDSDNEVNASCFVGQIDRSGASAFSNNQFTFDGKFDFNGNGGFKVKAWSAGTGTTVTIKLEDAADANINTEQTVTMTKSSEWEELDFSFSGADTYDKIVLFFDLNTNNEATYFFDDLMLVEGSGAACVEETAESLLAADLNVTFQTDPLTALSIVSDNAGYERVANPDFDNAVNSSCNVAEITRSGASAFSNNQFTLDAKLNFNVNGGFKIKAWSAGTGTTVTIKLEDAANAGINTEQTVTMTKSSEWEELNFTFASADDTYDKIVLFFDLNTNNEATYYFDDLQLVSGDGGGSGGGSNGCNDVLVGATTLPLDFEGCETFLSSNNFGAGISSTIDVNPSKDATNDSDFVLKVDRATGGNRFAGVQNAFPIDANPLDFTNNVLKLKIYSSKASTVFRFELALNPQTEPVTGNPAPVFVTVDNANTWTEVEVDFNTAAFPSGSPDTYNQLVIKPDNPNGTDGETNASDETFYFDDITVGPSSGGGGGAPSSYCNTEIQHFGGNAGSEARLTIESVTRGDGFPALKFTIAADPTNGKTPDALTINSFEGGNGLEAADTSVPGEISIEAFWPSGAPPNDETLFNVLWSFDGEPETWQLFETITDVRVPLDASCE